MEDWPDEWPPRLNAAIASQAGIRWKRILVLRETDSTQDAARRLSASPGDVITAWRQTTGRGRLGREWADTGEEGVAATFVVRRDPGPHLPHVVSDISPRVSPNISPHLHCSDHNPVSERLAIASAIAAARAIEDAAHVKTGIKWPNDIMHSNRKLAGVLIEQFDQVALIGIGINVSQSSWPDAIAGRAVSLRQIAPDENLDRLHVLERLLIRMDEALGLGESELAAEFAARDALRGRRISVRSGGQSLCGTVERIDPLRGLSLRDDGGCEHWLGAAVTTILDWPGNSNMPPVCTAEPPG